MHITLLIWTQGSSEKQGWECQSPETEVTHSTTSQCPGAHLVPPADPVWSWSFRGRLDGRGTPTILRHFPYSHDSGHHGVDGRQVGPLHTGWRAGRHQDKCRAFRDLSRLAADQKQTMCSQECPRVGPTLPLLLTLCMHYLRFMT